MSQQTKFLMKTLGDIIKGSTEEEVRTIVRDFVALLHHDGDYESMDRYRIVLEGMIEELEHEIKCLDTSKVPAADEHFQLGAEVGTAFCETLREHLLEAVKHCKGIHPEGEL